RAAAVYGFLYAPIALIVLFSFNSGHHASSFEGFSAQWYGTAANNPFVMEAVLNSLIVAATSASLATVLGTAAALALQRVTGVVRTIFDALIYIALIVPGIVIGIATLVAMVIALDLVNEALATLWMGDPAAVPRVELGYGSIIAAHTLFAMALVIVIVRARIAGMDRSLIEASADLYA